VRMKYSGEFNERMGTSEDMVGISESGRICDGWRIRISQETSFKGFVSSVEGGGEEIMLFHISTCIFSLIVIIAIRMGFHFHLSKEFLL
jgi:hypothetical protein